MDRDLLILISLSCYWHARLSLYFTKCMWTAHYYLFIAGHAGLSNSYKEDGLHYNSITGASNELLTEWKPEYDILPDLPFHLDIAGNLDNSSSDY